MKKLFICLAFLAALRAAPARASFHLWKFSEAFSNADGSVQFIEMLDPADGEEFVSGIQLKSNAHTFSVPANLPSALTANHHMLFATAGFGSLPGGVPPDYIIPANFFSPAGDTLIWAGGLDSKTFGPIPTDGTHSLTLPGATTGVNSPTNFAGQAGSVVPEPSAIVLLTTVISALAVRRRRARRPHRQSLPK